MPRLMPRSWPHPLAAGGATGSGSKGRYRLGRAVACVAPDGGGVGCPLRCGEPARGAEAEEWPSERPSGDGGGVLRTSQKEELMEAAGRRIALCMGAPHALVTNGAAAGLCQTVAAAIAGTDEHKMEVRKRSCFAPSDN